MAQVLRNYSYFQTQQAKRCKHFGSCLSPMHITQIPTFSPRQSCEGLPPGSCPMLMSHVPCAWAWQQKIRPSWVNRRFWLPCQRDGRFRSLWRHWRVTFGFLEKRHGSASPCCQGLWTRLRLEAMGREESVNSSRARYHRLGDGVASTADAQRRIHHGDFIDAQGSMRLRE